MTSLKISIPLMRGAAWGPRRERTMPKNSEKVTTPTTFIVAAASTMFGGASLRRMPSIVSTVVCSSAISSSSPAGFLQSAPPPPVAFWLEVEQSVPSPPGLILETRMRPSMTANVVVEAK
eukprot:CAMPEP_0181302224 /NCGR_PEP_ID=MMETSP1101-20121128/7861_1 /TAXON_ID=46948 /ORGANISM="Rhodomonas abbreviata, Strain Caron Lab Isolate" /LENGTH=119 /DNA_ID=CAMNT_0023407617 /DNA_START=185 /DNA_END=544 /DNA_ORIENTATION=+